MEDLKALNKEPNFINQWTSYWEANVRERLVMCTPDNNRHLGAVLFLTNWINVFSFKRPNYTLISEKKIKNACV